MNNSLFKVLVFIVLLFSCNEVVQHSGTRVGIRNESNYTITDISLLGIAFDDLKPAAQSSYKVFDFNDEKADPMAYLTVNGYNLSIYIEAPDFSGQYTYVIDNINFQNHLAFITRVKD
jgi:hypothetical protein